MSLTNIYNERYGTSVSANDNYIAVGNPPTHDYDPAEGFYRIGEVKLIKRDTFNFKLFIIIYIYKKYKWTNNL